MKKLSMKKTTAAAVAAAVGAALLLGGAGTLAYWTDTADSGTQTISSGELTLGSITGGGWVHDGPAGAAVTTIVPGDTITKTVSVPVKLVGDNIAAELRVEASDVVDGFGGELDFNIDVNASGTASLDLTQATDTTVPVVVTIEFPWGTPDTTTATQLKDYEFTIDYTLTQE